MNLRKDFFVCYLSILDVRTVLCSDFGHDLSEKSVWRGFGSRLVLFFRSQVDVKSDDSRHGISYIHEGLCPENTYGW